MYDRDNRDKEEIFSKALRAGSRTYFFDVRATKSDDYYLTITESKKQNSDNGDFFYKKHKIYLYKEDFAPFMDMLNEVTQYIIDEKGEEVISERHNPNFIKEKSSVAEKYSDVEFDDI